MTAVQTTPPRGQTRREYWVDLLKGIAIILVVLGHSQVSPTLINVIYSFHMPLFFMLSGYLDNSHREQTLRDVVRKKAPRLLWPYLTYGLIVIAYKTLTFMGTAGNFTTLLLKRVTAFLYGNHIWENNYDYIGTLWFLVGLFSVICISWLLHRIKAETPRLAVTGAVAVLGFLLSKLLLQWRIRLPWCLDVALIAIVFYELGLWYRQHNRLSGGKALLVGSLLLIVGFGFGAWNVYLESAPIGMLPLTFGNIPLFLIGASLICLGLMIVASCLYGRKRLKLLEYIGRQSLTVMVAHLYILGIVRTIGNKLIPGMSEWVCFLLATALSVLAAFIVDKLLPFLNDFHAAKSLLKRK